MGRVLDLARFYSPHEGQERVHRDGSKVMLLLGGWRSGKSRCAIWEQLAWCLEAAAKHGPGATFAVFRKTGPALEETIQKDWMNLPSDLIVKKRITPGRAYLVVAGGSRVIFRALDDTDKFGSFEFDGASMEEATEFDDADLTFVVGRLSGKWGPRRLLVVANPPTKSHWLYERFVTSKPPDWSVHHLKTFDNAGNLPTDYVASLEKMDEPTRRRYVHGEWAFVPTGTPVYSGFRESTHASRKLTAVPGAQNVILRGWDFGFRRPFCAWGQVFPRLAHANILRELPGKNVDIRLFCTQVKQMSGIYFPNFVPSDFRDYADPAGIQKNDVGTSAMEEIQKQGIQPYYRKLRIAKSIERVQFLISHHHLDRPMLMVDPSCRTIIDGFVGGYALGKNGEPIKDGEYDHGMDAIRIMLSPIILEFYDEDAAKSTGGIVAPRADV